MEKEQKKLLLVAVSVGVFLLVTITAAIAILSPKANIQETAYTVPYSSGRLQPATVGNEIPPAPNAQETKPAQIDNSGSAVDIIDNDSLTIAVNPKKNVVGVPDSQETPPPARTVAAVTPAAKPAEKPATPKAPAVKPAATPKAKTTKDYWVQTGAFSAKIRAEDSRELLASKGITSIIENSEVNGKTWYRVRVGPYTSENEANYWLALVKTINGFGDSQVRQTAR
jgi:DedD protein